MPTEKISESVAHEPCRDADHGPPSLLYYEPGIYHHNCPACGLVTVFTVRDKPPLRKRGLIQKLLGR